MKNINQPENFLMGNQRDGERIQRYQRFRTLRDTLSTNAALYIDWLPGNTVARLFTTFNSCVLTYFQTVLSNKCVILMFLESLKYNELPRILTKKKGLA